MRHQERNVSEFDEIITYPPSAAPSGEKQVMSCVQAFTAALGFAMSAGWDWLPSMHRLWLRDYFEAVSMPTPFGFFGTLSGSIFFKMIMLLALCPVMERLFLAFPLDRVAFRRKPLPNADSALFPSAIRERIYLSTPLILAQISAILLLLLLTFFLPPCLKGLMPWLLGTVSALFGLLWFVLLTLLPGVWELHLLRLGNHVQHRYFPAFGRGSGGVAGPFQDAVSPSFDPVDILCYAAFGRHQEACTASPPPTSVQPSGKGRLAARAAAAPVFVSGHPLQAGKRLFGFVRIPHYVWRSDTA